jgi:hypothetical protein
MASTKYALHPAYGSGERKPYRFGTMNGEPIILAQTCDGKWCVASGPAFLMDRWRYTRRRDLIRVLRKAISESDTVDAIAAAGQTATGTGDSEIAARIINCKVCRKINPGPGLLARAERWVKDSPGSTRDYSGYWVKLTSRSYAYREESGDITYWKEVAA